jgi:oligopeptide transport system ATP-binding protein
MSSSSQARRARVGDSPVPLLEVIDLKVHFPIFKGTVIARQSGAVQAVDGVSLSIRPGQTVGLVGESGCGKSTLGRAIVGLTRPTAGAVIFKGQNIENLGPAARRDVRRRIQMVFQDPYASLNPRMTIGETLAEPVMLHGLRKGRTAIAARVAELLTLVELDPAMAERYPHEFSGGQRQRVGIARALACEPDLIVCDEAVSALDVSIQAQVVKLLQRLQVELGIAYLFIAHGLGVVKQISDQVAVMYLGRIAETAPATELFRNPRHAYTRALISAAPIPDPKIERLRQRIVLSGDLPSPLNPPPGCRFHTRCPVAIETCRKDPPHQRQDLSSHLAACWRASELDGLMPMIKATRPA